MLLFLLALMGLASVTALSVGYACPQAAEAMPFMHNHQHGQRAVGTGDTAFCSACTAVLPSQPLIPSHALPPLALFETGQAALSGIDVGLDPPPPRFL
jgi:hypothetical protein